MLIRKFVEKFPFIKKFADKFSEENLIATIAMLAVLWPALLMVFSGINFNEESFSKALLSTEYGCSLCAVILVLAVITYFIIKKNKIATYAGMIFHLFAFIFFIWAAARVFDFNEYSAAPILLAAISVISLFYLKLLVIKKNF